MINEDLILDKNYRRGDKGKKVKLIQEWLCLHNVLVAIDRDFGPVTERAVKMYQIANNLKADGIVGVETFEFLIKPMREAIESPVITSDIGERIWLYGCVHLKYHPREVGGQNKGPWVRLYMDGKEGMNYPWCCGFVCYILNQAYRRDKKLLPLVKTFNVDLIVKDAIKKGMFSNGNLNYPVSIWKQITPGDLFICRKVYGDWIHIGIVASVKEECFFTIEGNTNDSGEREGYEVCKRIRGYKGKDFILINREK